MQEIKKTRIVIASVLKPVDDTRMYEKMGLSLASTGKAEVHIIGYPTTSSPTSNDIRFHPLKRFSRVSIGRITAAWVIAIRFIRLKPSVIIVTTHELLLAAVLTKFIRGSRIIYDVRENYYRNIVYTNSFPAVLRYFVAWHVRFKEMITAMFVGHFILAERGYDKELSFPGPRKTVIENKLKRPDGIVQKVNRRVTGSNFLFSGTLAETTGVFKAIELASLLHASDNSIQFTIVGYAAKKDVRTKIREAVKGKPYIRLVGIDTLVPHEEIIKSIQCADVGVIAYPPNKATENSIPTKLYEYLGLTLPIAIVDHKPWVEICDLWDGAVTFQYKSFDASEFLSRLRKKEFYSKIPQNVFWQDDEHRLITLVLGQK
jgi:glycosyltransferase involved in cell wall biosynthesis